MPRYTRLVLLGATALAAVGGARHAHAGCTPAPTVGGEVITCDAATPPDPSGPINFLGGGDQVTVNTGTYGAFTFPSDNNTLIFGPGGGAPTLSGGITFGTGGDRIEVHSGTITGTVDQGGGVDTFLMTGGMIVGNLEQSAGSDTFTMSGGVITGTFVEGDVAAMSGGSIGAVDLVTGNNVLNMSGGTIVGNLLARGGNDTLTMSGGSIGGNVDLQNGNNTITVSGGQIGAGITTGVGADTFTWENGGTILGAITLGAGGDTATLRNLTDANLTMSVLNGGDGVDRLVFDSTTATGVARFQNWDTVELINNTQLTLDGNFTLGGSDTPTGTMSIDPSSTLLAGGLSAAIQPAAPGSPVTVTNAGTIDLTNGPAAAGDSLTIAGNYIGADGRLNLHTVLGADGSPSDTLVISGAGNSASGSTAINVTNVGGSGAETVADGILVVQAANGATTAPGSFSLAGPAAAGAFEYILFRGGVNAGTADNWFLRSTVAPTPNAVPPPTPAPGSPRLPPPPPPGSAPIPLFRPEVAVHSVVPEAVRTLGTATIGTFHQRQGEQRLLLGDRAAAVWGRVFGQKTEESFAQGVTPTFDGSIVGLQAGGDVARFGTPGGHRDHLGFYVAHAQARGDVRGFVVGIKDASAGKMDLAATSFGAYWTHIGPAGWYVDAVLQGSVLDGSPHSDRGVSADISGDAFAASLEAGYPIRLSPVLVLEPQAQAIWQHLSIDNTRDRFSTIAFNEDDGFAGRIGARLYANMNGFGTAWQPYLKANLWWNANGTDIVTFAADPIVTEQDNGTSGEIGVGINGRLSPSVSVYGDASYLSNFSGEDLRSVSATVGLRVTW